MPIPTTDQMVLPVLRHIADGREYRRLSLLNVLTERFSLTKDERGCLSKSGQMERSLRNKGFIEHATQKWHYRITTRGLEFLNHNSEETSDPDINIETDRNSPAPSAETNLEIRGNNLHTEESIEENYQKIQKELATALLQQIKSNTPAFFEKLVIDLLVAMGYGGSWEDAGEVTGGPGDGGIDGIINQDKLGLDVVGVQAKLRTTGNNVSPSVINEFIGALRVKGLSKGVIITTASFSSNAKASAERSDNPKIVLIDGEQLADYMIEHNVGVSTTKTYEIKRVDSDYFAEDRKNA